MANGGDPRRASLKRLLRRTRAARWGRRPPTETAPSGERVPLRLTEPFAGYSRLGLDTLCRLLVNELDAMPVDGRARDAFVRRFGLVDPPESAATIAEALRRRDGHLGASPRRVEMLVDEALTALAGSLPDPPQAHGDPPMEQAHHPPPELVRTRAARDVVWARRLRGALAATRASGDEPPGAARCGRRPLSLRTAMNQLEADAFGGPPPTEHRGTPIAPWLRYRLRDVAWATVSAIDPFLDPFGDPLDRNGADGARETGGTDRPIDSFEERHLGPRRIALVVGDLAGEMSAALACEPRDTDAATHVLGLAESAYEQGLPVARELLGMARDGLAVCDLLRDRALVGRAIALHATLAAHASDPSAIRSVGLLRRLRGPTDPLSMRTALDLATTWSGHGFTRQALRLLWARLAALERLDPSPHRDFYRAYTAVRLAGTLAESSHRADRPDRVARLLDHMLDGELACDDPIVSVDLHRARAELAATRALSAPRSSFSREHARHAAALLREGDRSHGPPPRLLRSSDQPGVFGHRPGGQWCIAEARVNFAMGDADGFVRAQDRFARIWADEPLLPHWARTFRRLMGAAARALGTEPTRLAPPHPTTNWSPELTPPPGAIPDAPAPSASGRS